MPIKECTEDGRSGYQWGDSGKCFTHDGSEEGKRRARQRAEEQAAAAYASGYEGNGAHDVIRRKSLGSLTKMAPAQESDLSLIQRHAMPGVTLAADDVLIGSAKLAHDQYDRSHERFPKSYLDRFAETLPGKALMEGHDYDRRPSGRWFDAEVRQDSEGYFLAAKFYVNAKSAIAEDIRLGIAKDVSIGFQPDTRTCDLCAKDYDRQCEHWAGDEYDGKLATVTYSGDTSKVEAVEGSLVWLGCQPGAQVTGQSSPLYQRKMALAQAAAQGESMELKEALAEIERLKPLAEQGEQHKKQAEAYIASLRREVLRKTKVVHLATTRDEKAAEKAAEFTGKLLSGASFEHLEEMNRDLDDQLKVLTPNAQTRGADHIPDPAEEAAAKVEESWMSPRRRVY